MSTSIVLPQWGVLTRKHTLKLDDKPPTDWKLPHAGWVQWRDTRSAVLKQHLWPEFVTGKGWVGGAAANMVALTQLDLATMRAMQTKRTLEDPIQSKAKSPNALLHESWYRQEDVFEPYFGKLHRMYDTTIPDKTFPAVEAEFRKGLDSKVGTCIFQWKQFFQRPRPHQADLHLSTSPPVQAFSHEIAKSAVHPALPSGHCLQGLLVIGGVIEHILTNSLPRTEVTVDCLLQYAVDIGDRRVMAGVHYPSDNISSWYLGLLMADHLFKKEAEIKPRLWHAIEQMSSVYKALKDIPEYEPYLHLVREAANQPAT